MTTSQPKNVPDEPLPRRVRARLWFAQLGGGVAWTLHLIGCYLIAEWGCIAGLDRHQWLGIALPSWLLIGWTAMALLLGCAATLVALRLRRHAADRPEDRHGAVVRSGARAALWSSGLFSTIVAVQGVPLLFFLGGC